MAKKSYQRMDIGIITIRSMEGSRSQIEISGQNKKGTQVRIKATIDDWYLPSIIKDIAEIGMRRLQVANDLNKRIGDAIKH